MDIQDYSSKYANDRKKLQNTAKQMKESYDRSLEDLKGTHESKRAKESEHHRKTVSGMEKSQKDNLEFNAKKTDEILRKMKQEYHSRINDQKQDFETESTSTRNAFKNRLKNVKDNFNRNLNNIEEAREAAVNDQKTGIKSKMKQGMERAAEHERQLGKNFQKSLNESNKLHGNTKQRLVRDFQDKINNDLKASVDEKNDIKRQHLDKISQMDNSNRKHVGHLEEHHGKKLKDRNDFHTRNKELMTDRFQRQIEDTRESSTDSKKRVAQRSRDVIQEMSRDFSTSRNITDSKIKELSSQRSNLEESVGKAVEKENKVAEKRIKNFKQQMDENTSAFSRRIDSADEKTSNRVSDLKKGFITELTSKENNANAELKQQKISSGIDLKESQKTYYNHIADVEDKHSEIEANIHIKGKRALDNQKLEFGNALNSFQEHHARTLAGVKKDIARDKTSFIENRKKEHQKIEEGQRKVFKRNIQKTIRMFENELSAEKNRTEKSNERFQKKVSNLEEKFMDELMVTRQLYADKAVKDQKETQKFLDFKERQYFNRLMDLKNISQKKMADLKVVQEHEINKIVERYEVLLKEVKRDQIQQMKQYKATTEAKYNALLARTEINEKSTKSQYENKLNKMRVANAEARRLKESRS
ncbi:MAG: hypothetical protein KAQ98_06050 [Bacteriovoracaceae bacterium]|nr:hypothetical protein [Bacteriovoracaceae bacterium]